MIRTIYCAIIFTVFTVFYGIVGMVLSLVYRPFVVPYAVKPWAKTNLWAAGIKIDVGGLENLPKEGGCVVVSNHISWLDGILILWMLPRNVRFVVDGANFKSRILQYFASAFVKGCFDSFE